MIARGRGFGLEEDEDMPTLQGNLTPRDARLIVRIAKAIQTVFLFIRIVNKLNTILFI